MNNQAKSPMEVVCYNRAAWRRMAEANHRLTRPACAEELLNPLDQVDSMGWLGPDIAGWRVLCLAAGGGRHGPLYAAAGGIVTVVDFSPEMLERDRVVAKRHGLRLRLIESPMDDLSALENGFFDLVIHPVSTCYIADVAKVFREVARVCKPGALYISQHKQPASLQSSLSPHRGHYVWKYPADLEHPLPPIAYDHLIREPETYEYVHSLGSLLGGMCQAGFSIEDVMEPAHGDRLAEEGSFGHRARYIPPYLRIKARRRENPIGGSPPPAILWDG